MANKRKDASSNLDMDLSRIELLTLQFLDWNEPLHAYDIEKMIERVNAREWMDIGFSTIYIVLKRLEEKELVESQKIAQENKPSKIVYRKTEAGNECLRTEVSKLFYSWNERDNVSLFNQGMLSIYLFDKEELIQFCEQKIQTGKSIQKHIQMELEENQRNFNADYPVRWAFSYYQKVFKAELSWLENWIEELKPLDWEAEKKRMMSVPFKI